MKDKESAADKIKRLQRTVEDGLIQADALQHIALGEHVLKVLEGGTDLSIDTLLHSLGQTATDDPQTIIQRQAQAVIGLLRQRLA